MESLDDCVQQGKVWEDLPPHLQQQLGFNRLAYEKKLFRHSLQHQIEWSRSPMRNLLPQTEYYSEMVSYLRLNLRMYPYQFQDFLIHELQITPFTYYCLVMKDIMTNEKSYDVLPNFTAVDGVRVLGIGRNQYIDIMNKARAKKWMWKVNKGIVTSYLPDCPVPHATPFDPWFVIRPVVGIAQDVLRTCSIEEVRALEVLSREGFKLASQLPESLLQTLYRKQLVYVEVPIRDEDCIIVPPMQGFVMNRTTNDFFEKLLYDVLVSIDERTPVKHLTSILEVPEHQIKLCLSILCRLGLAKKKYTPTATSEDLTSPLTAASTSTASTEFAVGLTLGGGGGSASAGSPTTIGEKEGAAVRSLNNTNSNSIELATTSTVTSKSEDSNALQKRICFIFDSSLTAFLMMGNLNDGLKDHAVTMFEAGKMPDELLDAFLGELDKVEEHCGMTASGRATSGNEDGGMGPGSIQEGDARRYFDHAVILRETIKFLRRNEALESLELDLVRAESVSSLDTGTKLRILEKNYAVIIAMAPISAGSLVLDSYVPRFYGPPIPQVFSSPWFRVYTYSCSDSGPVTMLIPRGQRIRKIPEVFKECDKVMVAGWEQEFSVVSTATLVQVLNEALIFGPVTVQAYSYSDVEVGTFDVPFPLPEDVQSSGERDPTGACLSLAELVRIDGVRQVMQKLEESMHLSHSFGYIKMQRMRSKSATDQSEMWQPLEVVFGMPLFEWDINREMCKAIADRKLLSPAGVAEHTAHMQKLSQEFLNFVDANLTGNGLRLGEPCFPTQTILFDGANLQRLGSAPSLQPYQSQLETKKRSSVSKPTAAPEQPPPPAPATTTADVVVAPISPESQDGLDALLSARAEPVMSPAQHIHPDMDSFFEAPTMTDKSTEDSFFF